MTGSSGATAAAERARRPERKQGFGLRRSVAAGAVEDAREELECVRDALSLGA
jgi:hypothetical protein